MDVEQRQSGLVVPVTKPTRQYGPIEISGEEKRKRVSDALLCLWDAMNLSSGGGLLSKPGVWDTQYRLYRFIGETLLGEDCPEKGVLT